MRGCTVASKSAKHLVNRPVIGLFPKKYFGKLVWSPSDLIKHKSRRTSVSVSLIFVPLYKKQFTGCGKRAKLTLLQSPSCFGLYGLVMIALVWIIAIFLVVAVPSLLGAFIHYSDDPWRHTLREYQSVVGGLFTLFAAGLALVGVLITVTVQKQNMDRQLAEQRAQFDHELRERRATEDRAEAMRRRQVASAFVGEINVIMLAFRGQDWRQVAQKALDDLKRARETGGAPTVRLMVSRPTADYATFFRTNTREVGQFPQPIPQNLLIFYGIYTQLQDNLMEISRASDEDFKHMEPLSVEHALKNQLEQLDSLQGLGAAIVPELQTVADQPVQ